MRRTFVTTGPQGSGKSTFCEKVIAAHSELTLVSRDAILMELFGSIWLSPYTGEHLVGEERMWEVVASHLESEEAAIILDCWNGFPRERRGIVCRLRSLGADRVEAWLFTTPEDICLEWRLQRDLDPEEATKWTGEMAELTIRLKEDAFRGDYRLFHSMPVSKSQGFDLIRRIDPTGLVDFSCLGL